MVYKYQIMNLKINGARTETLWNGSDQVMNPVIVS